MYKTQIACLTAIIFIGVMSITSKNQKTRSSKCFLILWVCGAINLVFDATSVYTVNHLETVPPVLNRIVHDFFLGSLSVLFYLAYKYLETMIEEELDKSIYRHGKVSCVPSIISILGILVLPLYYVESERSNYSYGPAVYMTYFGVVAYVGNIIWLIMKYGKKISAKKRKTIRLTLLSEIPLAIY